MSSVKDQIVSQLKAEIITGRWKTGDKLPSENSLCARFNASRTSVRSALTTLCAEGIIDTHQGKGSFVQNIDRSNPLATLSYAQIDLFEFRRIFEMECSYLAALRATENLLSEMRESVTLMQYSKDQSTAIQQDMRFHYLIAEASGNSLFLYVFKMLQPAFWDMFSKNVSLRGNEGYREHLNILSAIEIRNPERAREYMVDHLNKSMIHKSESLFIE